MTIKLIDNAAIDLSDVSFGDYSGEYSFDYALDNGLLVNVTGWVKHEMGFGANRYRVQIAVTARLWRTLVTIAPLAKTFQTVTGRGNDVLWLAAYALHKAKRDGEDAARFQSFLPTADEWGEECVKHLYAQRGEDNDKQYVVIGYFEEFAML